MKCYRFKIASTDEVTMVCYVKDSEGKETMALNMDITGLLTTIKDCVNFAKNACGGNLSRVKLTNRTRQAVKDCYL